MYTIVMDKNKNLNTTVRSVIFKGENAVDKIQFLLPPQYDGNAGITQINAETGEIETIRDGIIDIADFIVTLKYVDPNGNFHSEVLAKDDEMYKKYYRYTLPVVTKFSQVAGDITMRLTLAYFDPTLENLEKMESNSTIVHIEKPSGFDDYVNWEDIAAWKKEIDNMNKDIKDLQDTMPDDLAIDENDDHLHLTHQGEQIGDGVEIIVPYNWDTDDGDHDGIIDVDNLPSDPGFIELD